MSRGRIALLVALAVPLLLVGVVAIAWAIAKPSDRNEAAHGVVIAGRDVGGESRTKVTAAVEDLAAKLATSTVRIDAKSNENGFRLQTSAADLGLSVDVAATTDAALAVGHDDPGLAGPIRWAKAFVADRPMPVILHLDRAKVTSRVEQLEGDRRTSPVEPGISSSKDGLAVVPGKAGIAIDIDAIAAKLPTSLETITSSIAVEAPRSETRPRTTDAAMAALVDAANATTSAKITLVSGDKKTELDGAQFRPGFKVVTDAAGAHLTLDPSLVRTILTANAVAPFNPTGVTFDLVDGKMVAKPGADATVCCGDKAPDQIAAALLAGRTTVTVDPVTITAADGVAQAATLGVNEVVGEFTTKHAAGQPRVKNIHRIADIVRGVLIAPGQTWSVNDFVGRRTVEKGFVTAPVIDQGEFSEDVGGGVSQFGTTLFNAAFFAGLDIPEHKAHSIYISRYPFGREATLAYPSVDLKITNNTPFGVVIWPTYTDTTLTVQLWSTKYATGTQASVTPPSGCGRITVVRDRVFVDGRTDSQKYVANYDCDPPKDH